MFFTREEISFPTELSELLAERLWGSKAPEPRRLKQSAQALGKLWEKLAKRRGLIAEGERHYSFLKPEAEAYASYYLPANALKSALVLEEAHLLGAIAPNERLRWLDCGTGPGTAFWGLAWWCRQRKRNLEFTGWDQSQLFTDIAARIAAGAFGFQPRFRSGSKENPLSLIRELSPNFVSFVNSVAEIYPEPSRRLAETRKILSALEGLSRKDGSPRYLLLIEPGSRDSSRELAELKDALQSDSGVAQALLPCLDARKCGALANPKDWCHEEVSCRFPGWLNELGSEAGMRKESVLFSYVLLGVGLDKKAQGGMRMVSQRLERKGQVECWLCTSEGKKFARVQRSKAGEDSKPLLEACRGDLWKDAKIGEKGDLSGAEVWPPVEPSIF